MANQPQPEGSACAGETKLLAEFIALCALVFAGSVAATIYFCRSMGGGVVLIVLGMMNPHRIVGVAIVIAAEKLLRRPEVIARLIGIWHSSRAWRPLRGLCEEFSVTNLPVEP